VSPAKFALDYGLFQPLIIVVKHRNGGGQPGDGVLVGRNEKTSNIVDYNPRQCVQSNIQGIRSRPKQYGLGVLVVAISVQSSISITYNIICKHHIQHHIILNSINRVATGPWLIEEEGLMSALA
jgi:hypothetical protein